MSRNSVIIFSFIVLLIIFVSAFSSSYTSHNMSNLAYVLALGIDIGENSKMKLSAQFTKSSASSPEGGSSDESSNIVLVSSEGDSIYSCLNLINTYIGKEINLSHCNVLIFSEEFAKKGISAQIYSLLNNEEFRPTTNLVISKCTAYDYLDNVKPNLEKLTVNYYDTFSLTNKFTGYFSDITVGEFYNMLSSTSCDGTAILGGLNKTARDEESDNETTDSITNSENLTAGTSSVEGKRGSENIGIAIFDNDKLCGELTSIETICHLLINNDIDSCIISIDNPYKENLNNPEEKLELSITPIKKSKVFVKIINDIPHIYIDLKLRSSLLTLENNIDYSKNDVIETISSSAEKYLEEQFYNYFSKISTNLGTDIDCFANKALSSFSTNDEWNNFNWPENFKNSKFFITINIKPD